MVNVIGWMGLKENKTGFQHIESEVPWDTQ